MIYYTITLYRSDKNILPSMSSIGLYVANNTNYKTRWVAQMRMCIRCIEDIDGIFIYKSFTHNYTDIACITVIARKGEIYHKHQKNNSNQIFTYVHVSLCSFRQ